MSLRNRDSNDRTSSLHRLTVRDSLDTSSRTSPLCRYPVILDLENHCSSDQQREMAKVLLKTFGGQVKLRFIDVNVFVREIRSIGH